MRISKVKTSAVDKSVWSSNYQRFQADLTTIFLIICLKK